MEESVSLALVACLGGHFFGISCQETLWLWILFFGGLQESWFFIYALRKCVHKEFTAHFHLWHDGAPDWRREIARWKSESANEWTLVSSRKKSSSKSIHHTKSVSFNPVLENYTPTRPNSYADEVRQHSSALKGESYLVSLNNAFSRVKKDFSKVNETSFRDASRNLIVFGFLCSRRFIISRSPILHFTR